MCPTPDPETSVNGQTNGDSHVNGNGNSNGNGATANPPRDTSRQSSGFNFQSVGDFLSNTNNFKIIESTLREGEQFANAYFDTGE